MFPFMFSRQFEKTDTFSCHLGYLEMICCSYEGRLAALGTSGSPRILLDNHDLYEFSVVILSVSLYLQILHKCHNSLYHGYYRKHE